jgi:ABC-type multidrug transport system ATPase subunit
VVAELVAEGLTKDYGDLLALAPLDLQVPAGQRVVVVGHNGSGKTTLLRMVAGLLEPSGGTVTVDGQPAGSLPARAATSYLPDDPVLYDDLSVAEHLEYTARLHGMEDWQERAAELVERLGLSERVDDLPSRFSRGLRQKTSVALGLLRPFSLLLVDEPFVGLDPPGREALLELLAAVSATLIVATHQMDYVGRAERCLALRDGVLTYDGPAPEADLTELVG